MKYKKVKAKQILKVFFKFNDIQKKSGKKSPKKRVIIPGLKSWLLKRLEGPNAITFEIKKACSCCKDRQGIASGGREKKRWVTKYAFPDHL